jgi:hypothetical protein
MYSKILNIKKGSVTEDLGTWYYILFLIIKDCLVLSVPSGATDSDFDS